MIYLVDDLPDLLSIRQVKLKSYLNCPEEKFTSLEQWDDTFFEPSGSPLNQLEANIKKFCLLKPIFDIVNDLVRTFYNTLIIIPW